MFLQERSHLCRSNRTECDRRHCLYRYVAEQVQTSRLQGIESFFSGPPPRGLTILLMELSVCVLCMVLTLQIGDSLCRRHQCGEQSVSKISAVFLFHKTWQFTRTKVATSLTFVWINLPKPTGYVMHHQFNITVRSAHTVFMCFVFIWGQTATCATYSINWLVFITEMKSDYSAVRTGSLNKAVCASSFRTNSDLCHLQH